MSNIINLKKGLDIKLIGAAKKKLSTAQLADSYAVTPDDFAGVTPKLLVKQNDVVLAGTPLFFDKYHPEVIFTSPVSGTVEAVVRGDKRKIMEVVIKPDQQINYKTFEIGNIADLKRERVVELMLESGVWPMVIQRPYGIIANPKDTPNEIFISGFDSAPLAPDMEFVLSAEAENIQAGVDVLRKLTLGKVHIGLNAKAENSVLKKIKNAELDYFSGKHPVGNVGVQIHHVKPIAKGDLVWTMDIQNLAILGRFFRGGKLDMTKIIALAGSEVLESQYFSVISGAKINSILKPSNVAPQKQEDSIRIINGNPLTGMKVNVDGFLNFYTNVITVIPEGNKHEFIGWIAPRFGKFSVSRSYFSWLTPNKKYNLDTNINGGQRAFVVTGLYDRYIPMDIYPMYLLKAIIAGDIDKMENYGIYEIIEEDIALCEFVDPSKTEMQEIVRGGINQMIKELN